MTGGHKTKPAGGVGGAVSPPAGFGAAPRKILKFKCFQTVKSPISTPSAGDKNGAPSHCEIAKCALLYMYITFEDMVL